MHLPITLFGESDMTQQVETVPPSEQNPPAGVDKSGERVQRMFGEIAKRYDVMNHTLSGGVDYLWRWSTIRKVKPVGELPLLDVCTGTGDLALAYWKKYGQQVAVTGTDFTPEMLEIAKQKIPTSIAQKQGQQSIEFLEADTQSLPFESDQFQIVSVAFGLRNVSDTLAGLKEMLRVCAPGGKVAVLEFSMPGNPVLKSLYSWYFRNVLPRIGQFFASNKSSAYNYLPDSVSEFPYGQALADIMTEAGMEEVRFTPYTFGIATLYVGKKPGELEQS